MPDPPAVARSLYGPRHAAARRWYAEMSFEPQGQADYGLLLEHARRDFDDAVEINRGFDAKLDAWIKLLAGLLIFAAVASAVETFRVPPPALLAALLAWCVALALAVFARRSFTAPHAFGPLELLPLAEHNPHRARFILAGGYIVAAAGWFDLNDRRWRVTRAVEVLFGLGMAAFVVALLWRLV